MNTLEIKYEELIQAKSAQFRLIITADNEVLLERLSVKLDVMGEPMSGCERVTDHDSAIYVYRRCARLVLNHIAKYKPYMMWWSVEYDPSRFSLYGRYSKLLESKGYAAYCDRGTFYCYRLPDELIKKAA